MDHVNGNNDQQKNGGHTISQNQSRQENQSRMTAIDDLNSSYRQLKLKNEVSQFAKKKVKRVIKLIEDLVKHYMLEAQ